MSNWRFISNHGAVLVYVARHPQATGTDIASAVGVQERSVRRIINDLMFEGYLQKKLEGRVNRYRVTLAMPLRRQMMRTGTVADLLGSLLPLVGDEGESGGGREMRAGMCPEANPASHRKVRGNP